MLSKLRNTSGWVTRCASGGVEAGAALLDEPEMEARRVGDRLEMFSGRKVAIVARNGREPPLVQARNGLREDATEIGVPRAAALARVPTGIYAELHEVGQPAALLLGKVRNRTRLTGSAPFDAR